MSLEESIKVLFKVLMGLHQVLANIDQIFSSGSRRLEEKMKIPQQLDDVGILS